MSRELIDGAQAIFRGAIDSGCNFFAGYPITPASGILSLMMKHLPAYKGICLQGEDEIASIGFCIAASMAGKRAMTATSGPGISLYSENIGLAIMGEVPLVIVNAQRLGPATGAATTSSEGDTQFVRWLTSGGIPMVVFSPIDIPTTYWLTTYAFKIAEKLRIPVILNTSKDLVMTLETIDTHKFKKENVIGRKNFLPIGASKQVRFTSSMHDEKGILTKDPQKIEKKIKHLSHKILSHQKELEVYDWIQNQDSQNLIIASGISARIAEASLEELKGKGIASDLLILYSVWPVPENIILKASRGKKRILVPEHNLGLYRQEIERLIPKENVIGLNRINGEFITKNQIMEKLL